MPPAGAEPPCVLIGSPLYSMTHNARRRQVSLGGGFAFKLLLIICGALLVGWLLLLRFGGASDRRSLS